MDSKTISKGILRALAIVLGIALLFFFLFKIKQVVIYIAIAAVISLIARPVIRILTKRLKFHNTLAVIVTIFLFFAFLFAVGSLIFPLLISQGENLSLLNSQEFKTSLEQFYNQLNEFLLSLNINLLEELKHWKLSFGLKEIPDLLNSVFSAFGNFMIGLFSVLFISFFLMKDRGILTRAIVTLAPAKSEDRFKASLEKIKNLLSRYFIGLLLQISTLFIMYTITLLLVGVDNAIIIAFLAAPMSLIPYIGPIIAWVLITTLTVTSNIGLDFQTQVLPKLGWILMGHLIAHGVDNFITQPLIFSKSVKSHPLEIFLIIIMGGLLFGIPGMILAVPTYTAIKVILKEFLSENKIVKSLTQQL